MQTDFTTLDRHSTGRFLTWTGMETDLIFNRNVEVPGFAAFPLLADPATRAVLDDAFEGQIDAARTAGLGVILESLTWMASRDRAAEAGIAIDADALARANRDAVAQIARLRAGAGIPVVLSGNIGPRGDAYAPGVHMTAGEAEAYHAEQAGWLASAGVDLVSAYTIPYAAEAIGIARAVARTGLPVVISFVVETDGRLPGGERVADAVAETDAETGGSVAYYMLNCAHPDHLIPALAEGGASTGRLGGLVVNASRCSHEELDAAETLDDGDPAELGDQMGALVGDHPGLRVVGGCCGTDRRHLAAIASVLSGTSAPSHGLVAQP